MSGVKNEDALFELIQQAWEAECFSCKEEELISGHKFPDVVFE